MGDRRDDLVIKPKVRVTVTDAAATGNAKRIASKTKQKGGLIERIRQIQVRRMGRRALYRAGSRIAQRAGLNAVSSVARGQAASAGYMTSMGRVAGGAAVGAAALGALLTSAIAQSVTGRSGAQNLESIKRWMFGSTLPQARATHEVRDWVANNELIQGSIIQGGEQAMDLVKEIATDLIDLRTKHLDAHSMMLEHLPGQDALETINRRIAEVQQKAALNMSVNFIRTVQDVGGKDILMDVVRGFNRLIGGSESGK